MTDPCQVTSKLLLLCRKIEVSGGWPCVVFVNRIKEAEELSNSLSQGLHAVVQCITSKVGRAEREKAKQQIIDGSLKLVVATPVWGTGINIPNLKSVILAGRGRSAIRLKQMAGRATRKHLGKKYVIYDLHAFDDNGIQRLGILADAGFDVPSLPVSAPVDLGKGAEVLVNAPVPAPKITQEMIDRERSTVLILIGMLFTLIVALALVSELTKGCGAG